MSQLLGPPLQLPANLGSLDAFIRSLAAANPGALLAEMDRNGKTLQATLDELLHRAQIIRAAIDTIANPRVNDIAVCCESVLEFVPAAWAAIFGGYNVLPLQYHSGSVQSQTTSAKLAALARRLRSPLLVTTRYLGKRLEVESHLFADKLILDDVGPGVSTVADVPAGQVSSLLISTSGTTGDVKIAEIPAAAYLARVISNRNDDTQRATLSFSPFDTITGSIVIAPSSRLTFYLQPDRFARNPLEVLSLITRLKVARLGLTSSSAARLSSAIESSSETLDLSSVTDVTFGAESIIPAIVTKIAGRIESAGARHLRATFGYGMTETSLICCTPPQPLSEIAELSKAPSVGTCTAGYGVRIADASGSLVPPGQIGEIQVARGPKMFTGYYGDEAETAKCFSADGWFKTGDLGYIENGALTVTGRDKALIIVNGRNISLDHIEQTLRPAAGLHEAQLVAAGVHDPHSPTEALALFFVPENREPAMLDALCRRLTRQIAQEFGVTARHLFVLSPDDMPRTANGKAQRHELTSSFLRGDCKPHVLQEPKDAVTLDARLQSGSEAALTRIWAQILKCTSPPGRQKNFYDLGGSSLASAELLFAAEKEFSCEIPIEDFFHSPTIADMAALIDTLPRLSQRRQADAGGDLIRTVRSFTVGWAGRRLVPEGLIIGTNTDGHKPPLYWVFQDQREFEQLASHLGPDQPLYGMRSLAGIVPVKGYTADVLDIIARRYAREILALPAEGQLFVGGNCQGAIIALALARLLNNAGRHVRRLILMEWNFNYGRYESPTLLLHGAESQVAQIFALPLTDGPDWRRDFPDSKVASFPGTHGTFFKDANIAGLAAALRQHLA